MILWLLWGRSGKDGDGIVDVESFNVPCLIVLTMDKNIIYHGEEEALFNITLDDKKDGGCWDGWIGPISNASSHCQDILNLNKCYSFLLFIYTLNGTGWGTSWSVGGWEVSELFLDSILIERLISLVDIILDIRGIAGCVSNLGEAIQWWRGRTTDRPRNQVDRGWWQRWSLDWQGN